MKIAVPKETRAHETRVAAVPETVKKFTALGAEVHVQAGAGEVHGHFYHMGTRSTPTAIRLEGLSAVYAYFQEAGTAAEKERVAGWESGLAAGRRFLLRCQYTGAEGRRWKGDLDPRGGIRFALELDRERNGVIRIDYCQHAASALLGW